MAQLFAQLGQAGNQQSKQSGLGNFCKKESGLTGFPF